MTARNNVFVSNPGLLAKIKVTGLRKLMMLGACLDTPLQKKATFNYTWTHIKDIGDCVTKVEYFPPASDVSTKTFNLNSHTQIPLSEWYSITTAVCDYPEFRENIMETKRIKDIVKRFEEAAGRHGARKSMVVNGFISDEATFLSESGKALSVLRKELYGELGV